VFVFLYLEGGNTLIRRTSGLVLSAAIGGDRVCGLGHPGAQVQLERIGPTGAALGSWDLTVGRDARFAVDTAESVPRIGTGERWQAVSGPQTADWTVPKLEWQINWPAFAIDFLMEPGQVLQLEQPIAADCWGRFVLPEGVPNIVWDPLEADPDGRARARLDATRVLAPESLSHGVGGSMFDNGHRLHFSFYPLQVVAHLGTNRLDVRTGSGSVVSASTANATGEAQADDVGWADIALTRAAGGPEVLETGTTLDISANGERAEMTIPLVDFDFSTAVGAVGQASPGTSVRVTFTAQDGATYAVNVATDESGIWRVPPTSSEDRGSFSLLDLASIRAEVPMGDRHTAVRTATFAPPERIWTIHVPLTLTTRQHQ
jgi:hypothetical protein